MPDLMQQFTAVVVLALVHSGLPEQLAMLLATLDSESTLAVLANRLLRWILRVATPLLPELQLQHLLAQANLVNAAARGVSASTKRINGRDVRATHESGILAAAVLGTLQSDVTRLGAGGVVCRGAVDRFTVGAPPLLSRMGSADSDAGGLSTPSMRERTRSNVGTPRTPSGSSLKSSSWLDSVGDVAFRQPDLAEHGVCGLLRPLQREHEVPAGPVGGRVWRVLMQREHNAWAEMKYKEDIEPLVYETGITKSKTFMTWNWSSIDKLLCGAMRSSAWFNAVFDKSKFVQRLGGFFRAGEHHEKDFVSLRWSAGNLHYARTGRLWLTAVLSHARGLDFLDNNRRGKIGTQIAARFQEEIDRLKMAQAAPGWGANRGGGGDDDDDSSDGESSWRHPDNFLFSPGGEGASSPRKRSASYNDVSGLSGNRSRGPSLDNLSRGSVVGELGRKMLGGVRVRRPSGASPTPFIGGGDEWVTQGTASALSRYSLVSTLAREWLPLIAMLLATEHMSPKSSENQNLVEVLLKVSTHHQLDYLTRATMVHLDLRGESSRCLFLSWLGAGSQTSLSVRLFAIGVLRASMRSTPTHPCTSFTGGGGVLGGGSSDSSVGCLPHFDQWGVDFLVQTVGYATARASDKSKRNGRLHAGYFELAELATLALYEAVTGELWRLGNADLYVNPDTGDSQAYQPGNVSNGQVLDALVHALVKLHAQGKRSGSIDASGGVTLPLTSSRGEAPRYAYHTRRHSLLSLDSHGSLIAHALLVRIASVEQGFQYLSELGWFSTPHPDKAQKGVVAPPPAAVAEADGGSAATTPAALPAKEAGDKSHLFMSVVASNVKNWRQQRFARIKGWLAHGNAGYARSVDNAMAQRLSNHAAFSGAVSGGKRGRQRFRQSSNTSKRKAGALTLGGWPQPIPIWAPPISQGSASTSWIPTESAGESGSPTTKSGISLHRNGPDVMSLLRAPWRVLIRIRHGDGRVTALHCDTALDLCNWLPDGDTVGACKREGAVGSSNSGGLRVRAVALGRDGLPCPVQITSAAYIEATVLVGVHPVDMMGNVLPAIGGSGEPAVEQSLGEVAREALGEVLGSGYTASGQAAANQADAAARKSADAHGIEDESGFWACDPEWGGKLEWSRCKADVWLRKARSLGSRSGAKPVSFSVATKRARFIIRTARYDPDVDEREPPMLKKADAVGGSSSGRGDVSGTPSPPVPSRGGARGRAMNSSLETVTTVQVAETLLPKRLEVDQPGLAFENDGSEIDTDEDSGFRGGIGEEGKDEDGGDGDGVSRGNRASGGSDAMMQRLTGGKFGHGVHRARLREFFASPSGGHKRSQSDGATMADDESPHGHRVHRRTSTRSSYGTPFRAATSKTKTYLYAVEYELSLLPSMPPRVQLQVRPLVEMMFCSVRFSRLICTMFGSLNSLSPPPSPSLPPLPPPPFLMLAPLSR